MSQVEWCLLLPWYVNTDRLWNLDLSVKELRGRDYSKANSTLENHGESRRSALMFSASRTLTLLRVGVRCDSKSLWILLSGSSPDMKRFSWGRIMQARIPTFFLAGSKCSSSGA